MLDLKLIINNQEIIKNNLKTKNFDVKIIDQIIKLSVNRSETMTNKQILEAKKNKLSKKIGDDIKNNQDTKQIILEVEKLKTKIKNLKEEENNVQFEIKNLLDVIPNLVNKNVPVGKNELNNIVIKEYSNLGKGKIKVKLPHEKIGLNLNILDFENSVKMSGTRFWSYIGLGAKLVRALIDFMIDEHTINGYKEINPPLIVNSHCNYGVGQLPKFKDDLFKIHNRDSYLISTGEVPLTCFYYNQIINLVGPIKLTSYTPCFRQEAGSGGKDIRGIIRGHQFHKVELFKIVNQENAHEEFIKTIEDSKNILKKLELPFQEVQLCTGDLSFSSSETIDLEVWIPSQQKYREISSISIFNDFQSRRLKIRYKDKNNQIKYPTTINGSGLAIDRTIAAILENYQNDDGTVTIPKILRPYMNNLEFIG